MSEHAYLEQLFTRHPSLTICRQQIEQTAEVLLACFRAGNTLLLAGNGGSAADCLHIAGELLKGFHLPRSLDADDRAALTRLFGEDGVQLGNQLQRGLPAIALMSETALITAVANDISADMIYAQGVMAYGKPGDVLLALSTSGGAANVIAAARVARWKGLTTIALTGKDGGTLARVCEIAVITPGANTPEIQEYHLAIYHALCAAIEAALF